MSYYGYNLYYTLNGNIPSEPYPEDKRSEISNKISTMRNEKSRIFILLILEHAFCYDKWPKDDMLKGIFPYDMEVRDGEIFINEKILPHSLMYILEKALAFV
jgi:hypothetical protein